MDAAPISKFDDAEAKQRMIAEAAYFVAETRGFVPGYELDDWLQAEQEVEASMEPTETIREMQSQAR